MRGGGRDDSDRLTRTKLTFKPELNPLKVTCFERERQVVVEEAFFASETVYDKNLNRQN